MGIRVPESALRRGLGIVGKTIGTTFSVYRIGGLSGNANAAKSVIDPLNLVLSNFQMRAIHETPKSVLENEPLYRMLYTGQGDVRHLKVNDILVETGPGLTDTPDGRIFVFVGVTPLLPAVFARVEVLSQISRTYDESGTEAPLLGYMSPQGGSKFYEWTLQLNEGLYDLAPTGVSASIPMGIQPRTKPGAVQEYKYPTATHRGAYVVYCPLLPGFQLQPGDYFTGATGDRFRVQSLSMFTTGLQGYQIFAESVFV